MKYKIAFHSPQLCLRGTSVAMYDYARFNEELLENESIIVLPISNLYKNDPQAVKKFSNRFAIFLYEDMNHLNRILKNENCNVLYCIKYGKNDNVFSTEVKTVIHCVFDMSEPHGNVYAGVSREIALKYNKLRYVPHMVSIKPILDVSLREKLKIPKSAIVFGRYGGLDTFNLEFCKTVISRLVNEREDLFFLFINTPKFYDHVRIVHLPTVIYDYDKSVFINTCDAHIECGTMGHSFGLAIAEFSVHNKPVIAYVEKKTGTFYNNAHINILKDKGLYYSNEEEFETLLRTFDPKNYRNKDNNAYRDYTPEKVMDRFKEVFLS